MINQEGISRIGKDLPNTVGLVILHYKIAIVLHGSKDYASVGSISLPYHDVHYIVKHKVSINL